MKEELQENIHRYQWIQRTAVIIGLADVLLSILFWKRIPSTIASHYNAAGVIDTWSDKSALIVLYFFVLILTGIMSLTVYFLKMAGTSSHASMAEQRVSQHIYPMFAVMHLVLQLMFLYINFCSVTCRNLWKFFLPVVVIGIFAPMAYYLFRYGRSSGNYNPVQKAKYVEMEGREAGECYRTRIDWWLGLILLATFLIPVGIFAEKLLRSGKADLVLILTQLLLIVLYVPLACTKYILYSDHLTIVCFMKARISYCSITRLKETHNPLSSAALSMDRLQIEYVNDYGNHEMVLISPIRKKEFMQKIEEKRQSILPADEPQ